MDAIFSVVLYALIAFMAIVVLFLLCLVIRLRNDVDLESMVGENIDDVEIPQVKKGPPPAIKKTTIRGFQPPPDIY